MSGLAHQTLKSANSLDQFGEDFTGRLAALGRSHEILTAVSWEDASLHDLIHALIEPYVGSEGRIAFDGPSVLLPSKHFLALSMIVYELLTNAVKYGALSTERGALEIAWIIAGGHVDFNWKEGGSVATSPPARQGFGTRMIEFSARHDLSGEAHWNWTPTGMVFELRFPLPGF